MTWEAVDMSDSRDLVRWQYDSAKDKRIAELKVALREIAEHPHITDESWFPCYDSGHREGHRCAAEIARKALEGK